jgi:carbonic anhydrase
MENAKPLPTSLIKRYHGWRATTFEENREWYTKLAEEGQHPRSMVISCCDSRVQVTSFFGAETGDFFIHRNIAALVPPYQPNQDYHGTSAAIEYAVTGLKVANILIVGHTQCGGVKACHDMCSGAAPELEEESSFVGRWMDILRPGFERVSARDHKEDEKVAALEKESILVSLENLSSFPFVKSRVDEGSLAVHGLIFDIHNGSIEVFDPENKGFAPI